MPVNNLSLSPAAVTLPPPGLKAVNKPQPAAKPPAGNAGNAPPIAQDKVTISKTAAALNAAAEKPKTVAAETTAGPAKGARSSDSQRVRLTAEQAAAIETQKSTPASSQEVRGTLRISKMI